MIQFVVRRLLYITRFGQAKRHLSRDIFDCQLTVRFDFFLLEFALFIIVVEVFINSVGILRRIMFSKRLSFHQPTHRCHFIQFSNDQMSRYDISLGNYCILILKILFRIFVCSFATSKVTG